MSPFLYTSEPSTQRKPTDNGRNSSQDNSTIQNTQKILYPSKPFSNNLMSSQGSQLKSNKNLLNPQTKSANDSIESPIKSDEDNVQILSISKGNSCNNTSQKIKYSANAIFNPTYKDSKYLNRVQTAQNLQKVFKDNHMNRKEREKTQEITIEKQESQPVIERGLNKDEKLKILKQKKEETACKIRAKLDIYASVRPYKADKQKERATKEFLSSIKKHNLQLDEIKTNQRSMKNINTDEKLKINTDLISENLRIQKNSTQMVSRNSPFKKDQSRATITLTNNQFPSLINTSTTFQNLETINIKDTSPSSHQMNHSKSSPQFRHSSPPKLAQLRFEIKQLTSQTKNLSRMSSSEEELRDIDDISQISETNPILIYVLNNDVKEITKELEPKHSTTRKIMINQRDSKGRTLLFYSVIKNHYESSEILLRNGAETLYRDYQGRTVLHIAVMMDCDLKLIELLMDYKKLQDDQKLHTYEALQQENVGKLYDKQHLQMLAKSQARKNIKKQQMSMKGQMNQESGVDSGNEGDKEEGKFSMPLGDSNENSGEGSSRNSSRARNQMEEQKAAKFEIQLKGSKRYKEQVKNYANLVDKYGKSPLHYATKKRRIDVIKYLLKNQASLYLRDYKQRKPAMLTKDLNIQIMLEKEQKKFEENYNLKKKIQNAKFNASIISNLSSISFFSNFPIGESKMYILRIDTFRHKNLDLGPIERLASYSNQQLCIYHYGLYGDNALTYTMRIDDKDKFVYLLKRGIFPQASDKEGCNALHYAIRMNKIDFLSYMLEGDFQAYEQSGEALRLQTTLNTSFHNKSFQPNITSTSFAYQATYPKKGDFIIDGLLAICQSSFNEGLTPFHEAAKYGHQQILQYLFKILKLRNEYLNNLKYGETNLKSVSHVLELTDANNLTALLHAAKNSHFDTVKLLVDEGANPYATCREMNNCLHYAVLNQNEDMVRFLLKADVESQLLKNEKNVKNQRPEMLDSHKQYAKFFLSPWELASIKGAQAIEKLAKCFKSKIFSATQQTLVGKNTPMHFAVLYNNLRAIRVIQRYTGDRKLLEVQNADGLSPQDFIQMHKSERVRQKLQLVFSSNGSLTSNSRGQTEIGNNRISKFQQRTSYNVYTEDDNNTINDDVNSEDSFYYRDNTTRGRNLPDSRFQSSRDLFQIIKEEDSPGQVDSPCNNKRDLIEPIQVLPLKNYESFIADKQRQYYDEKRLGAFNPELYSSIYYGSQHRVEKQFTVLRETLNQLGFSDQIVKNLTQHERIQKTEEIFKQIEQKQKSYIVYQQVMDQWYRFEEVLDKFQLITLKFYLERYYKETKITKANFIKIMSFYINDQ